MFNRSTLTVWLSLALVAPLATGCAKKNNGMQSDTVKGAKGANEGMSVVEERVTVEESSLIKQRVDLDRDGKPELINFFRERSSDRVLVKKELDLNRDGRMDLISYFDNDGVLTKEEMDGDYDGQFDWTDHYRDGVRVMSEYDTEADGKPNVFKYYQTEEGKTTISRKERDSTGDGNIDFWEKFDKDGKVIRTGADLDGDGKMDERSE